MPTSAPRRGPGSAPLAPGICHLRATIVVPASLLSHLRRSPADGGRGIQPAITNSMEQVTLIDMRGTFARRLARHGEIRAQVEKARGEKDEYAFTRGMLVGLPLSLALWAILIALGSLLV
jgi:hypothetical protein